MRACGHAIETGTDVTTSQDSQDKGAKRPKTGTTTAPTTAPAATARPEPATPGVIASAEIGAGKPAQAGQPGEITPIGSTLVGDTVGGHPAADPKPSAAAAAAGTGAAKTPEPSAAKGAAASPAASSASASGSVPASAPASGGASGPKAPAAAPRRSGGGFLPLAFGGAVAAGLGAVAAIYALPHLPPAWQPTASQQTPAGVSAPVDEVALIAAAEDVARRVVAEEIAALPTTDAMQPTQEVLDGIEQQAMRIDALEEQLAALPDPQDAPAETGAAAAPEVPDLSPQLAELQQRLDDQQAELQQRLDAQQAELDELAARPAFDPDAAQALQQQISDAAAEAEQRIAAAQAEAEALQEAAAASTRRAEAVAAIAALQSALDLGVTPDQAREALSAAGLDAPEALAVQVPSLSALQTEFPEAARAALRAGLRAESAGGQGNLVTNFLRAQTGARSVAPREGADPDAVLSRADAQVAAGQIAAALDELAALPEAARTAPAMADWLAGAEAYASAQAALSDLSSDQN